MKALYKDENGNYAVMEVLKASYLEEEEMLELCGSEEDLAFQVTQKEAKKIVRELYENDRADVSSHPCSEIDLDDEDFFDDEEEEDAFIERLLDMSKNSGSKGIVFSDEA